VAVELAPEGVDPCIEQVGRFLERLVGFLRQDLEAGARDGVGHSPSEPHRRCHVQFAGLDVQVIIRVWDTPPTPPAAAEGHVPVSIESETGTLVVNQLEYGPAGEMTLPRPGVYEGHA